MSAKETRSLAAQVALDPVCGMTIDPADAAGHAQYAGRTYYFCSVSCLERFKANPARLTSEAAVPPNRPAASSADAVEYTCPMHPEIVRDARGNCPICGMALEPRTITSPDEGEENPELVDMTRRFWVSAVLTAPLILIAMAHDLPGPLLEHLASPTALRWVELALATPVVLCGG
jgi:Cu+-exporting ATPase